MQPILYNKFFGSDHYNTLKGDGGNLLYEEMLRYVKEVKDEKMLVAIKDEIETWLLIGRSSFLIMAVNLISDLQLHEYKQELETLKLKIIKKHPIKNHTILIDDRRDFNTMNFDNIGEEKIIQLVKEVNPNYQISYDTGADNNPLFKNDILVARIL